MKKIILNGSVDQSIDIFIQSTASATGEGLAALAFDSPNLACWYRVGSKGAATQLALATQTVAGEHADGGFKEIDATHMKGIYRLDISDDMITTSGSTIVYLYGADNMVPCIFELQVGAISATLSTEEHEAIADAHIARNIGGGSNTGRTVGQVYGTIRNKVSVAGNVLTVYGTDDTTVLYTAIITTSAAANPIIGIDPS